MEEDQPLLLVQEANESFSTVGQTRNNKRWIRISIYAIFLLCGQSVATLLGRSYFVNGGNSKWIATLVQIAGFPVLIPYYFISTIKRSQHSTEQSSLKIPSSVKKLALVYAVIGLLLAVQCYLYSTGLDYLPVSTYTMISASQLGFTCLFSFLLKLQKLTPFIVNSLVLLTISSVLLVFTNESADPVGGSSDLNYAIGFVSTIAGSAVYGLMFSLTQFFFQRVIRTHTFKAVMEMIIYDQMVASSAIMVGLFGSGEWKDLREEMDGYETGKDYYLMNLVGTAVSWEAAAIGSVGLIFEVSSLFSNAIVAVGLPIVPVLFVFIFHDEMNGVKAISLVLAVLGFVSYVCQHYLDDRNCRMENDE